MGRSGVYWRLSTHEDKYMQVPKPWSVPGNKRGREEPLVSYPAMRIVFPMVGNGVGKGKRKGKWSEDRDRPVTRKPRKAPSAAFEHAFALTMDLTRRSTLKTP